MGRRNAVVTGLLANGAALAGFGLARGLLAIYASGALAGLGFLVFPLSCAIGSGAAAAGEQGEIQAALDAVRNLANGVAPLVFGSIFNAVDHGGAVTAWWGAPFLGAALLLVLAAGIAAGLPAGDGTRRQSEDDAEAAGIVIEK